MLYLAARLGGKHSGQPKLPPPSESPPGLPPSPLPVSSSLPSSPLCSGAAASVMPACACCSASLRFCRGCKPWPHCCRRLCAAASAAAAACGGGFEAWPSRVATAAAAADCCSGGMLHGQLLCLVNLQEARPLACSSWRHHLHQQAGRSRRLSKGSPGHGCSARAATDCMHTKRAAGAAQQAQQQRLTASHPWLVPAALPAPPLAAGAPVPRHPGLRWRGCPPAQPVAAAAAAAWQQCLESQFVQARGQAGPGRQLCCSIRQQKAKAASPTLLQAHQQRLEHGCSPRPQQRQAGV